MAYHIGTHISFKRGNKQSAIKHRLWDIGTHITFVKVRFLDDGEQPISLRVNGLVTA